jgi:hypothetical protein
VSVRLRARLVEALVRRLERRLLLPRAGAAAPGLAREWVGERTVALLDRFPPGAWLELRGLHHPHGDAGRVLHVRLSADGHGLGSVAVTQAGPFRLRAPLPPGLLPPLHVTIEAEPAFVPDEVLHNHDTRRVCFILEALGPAAA